MPWIRPRSGTGSSPSDSHRWTGQRNDASKEGLDMTLHRRRVLQFLGAGATLAAAPRTALGQAYPSHTIRWLVGAAAGSAPDVLARLVGQPLSERLGQPIVVENKPGAGGNLAVAEALRAPADGYSILFVTSANAINATLYKKLTFDFVRDIAPVAGLTRGAFAMLVHPSLPVRAAGRAGRRAATARSRRICTDRCRRNGEMGQHGPAVRRHDRMRFSAHPCRRSSHHGHAPGPSV